MILVNGMNMKNHHLNSNRKKIYAFIFARKGSKSIKNKNLKKIGSYSLVEHSIVAAKKIKSISRIFVSTDSHKIKKISRIHKVDVIDRPEKFAKDNSNEISAWKHAIKHVEKKIGKFDVFLSLPPTSPLRNTKDITSSIQKLDKNSDLVLSVSEVKNNPYFNMVSLSKNNKVKLLSYNKSFKGNRQNYKNIYNITTVAYVAKPEFIKNAKNLFSSKFIKVNIIPLERSIDIDSPIDLNIAKFLYEKNNKN